MFTKEDCLLEDPLGFSKKEKNKKKEIRSTQETTDKANHKADKNGKQKEVKRELGKPNNRLMNVKQHSKEHKFIILSSLALPFLGASGYILFSSRTKKAFVLFGIISVLANICISLFYAFNNRDKLGELPDNKLVIIIYTLTLVIPYSIFYTLFAILLIGIHFLFNF